MTAKNKATLLTDITNDLRNRLWNYHRRPEELLVFFTDLLDSVANSVDGLTEQSKVRRVAIAFDSSSPVDIGNALPANSTVLGYWVNITTLFDGTTPTLDLGDDSAAADGIASGLDLASAVLLQSMVFVNYATASQLIATLNLTGASQGAAEVLILYNE